MLQKGDQKLINSWAFYDWANSVYSLVIATAVFPLYFSAITKDEVVNFLWMKWEHPDTLYSYALSFSFLVVAFISPILSGIADYTGSKKKFMKFFCALGSISVMSLYFFDSVETVWIGIVFTVLASIGFWASLVFYNAYLPEIAHPEQQDRASAKGFIFGYIGSVILLIINLIMIQKPDLFALSSGTASRISFVMVGLWWLGFAQITFKRLPKNIYNKKPEKDYIWKGFRELKIVAKEMLKSPTLKRFLISFFLLSVGVQTIILLATIFGSTELGLEAIDLIITVLLIQIVAIFGAYLFSRISEKKGNFLALKITIFIWMIVCFCAFLLHKELPNVAIYFYALGAVLGLVLGAIQSLSRSTYSKLLPETQDHTTYFSFYDVTEKIAIVLGTLVYGLLFAITDSMQWSVLCLALFFLASFIVLSTLKKTKYVK
ncbi:MAG: MFS transporter [Flavobacteriia bacterium]|nr:MFS transporter [Flavobacteriia bacterium]OIP48739.1 MAG: MFS transporter [Flavobacteriaceae bacterium CG2_30_31_66]PIV95459.1 MAG: MFS transporter [Flavobacteriaceae bacterium CG17_big_fil_post_rev_8_21_14_2_50_31_13]PIX12530.1 MAG: MFS transporter [Flavobacteriaceae bacterium CG_4_8_14_3_um_filter_31_8]PIY14168.1 MAG: MFS transporter [Flavobacteriaceae bacterium CG_4_10_14_3_um_filter_31_253]PIZ10277.1 MAG: MFS transporter [Flavobacteriaceae bacterium CG_4_10_14_0_8_um_filter_31_99]PJC10